MEALVQVKLRIWKIKKDMIVYFFLGIVSSSTNLNRDNCLYAINTTRAIIRKSIILDTRCPILNFVVLPDILGTCKYIASRFLAGKSNPISGFMMSSTKEVTSPEAAWPITNAIASPIIPNVFRKKNSWTSVFYTITTFSVGSSFFISLLLNSYLFKTINKWYLNVSYKSFNKIILVL